MDAMSSLSPGTAPPLPPAPAPRPGGPATPAPAVAPATSLNAPPPALETSPLPLSVQREQLRPPAVPLMTGEEMTALLRALLGG